MCLGLPICTMGVRSATQTPMGSVGRRLHGTTRCRRAAPFPLFLWFLRGAPLGGSREQEVWACPWGACGPSRQATAEQPRLDS